METSIFIHPSAIIDEGAQIGINTKVWHFAHLMPQAVVGPDCTIGQNVFIDNGVTLGKGVKIQNNVSVYKGVEIEDEVFIGPSVVFTNVINPRSFIERKAEFKQTIVHRGATIGANATILCGIELGKYCFIGAGAVVTKNVKPFSLVTGNPARHVGWISKMGYTLSFNNKGEATCKGSGEHYLMKDDYIYLTHQI